LPFLPNEPVTHLTDITPHQAWLAALAACSISYASYLLQHLRLQGEAIALSTPPAAAGG